jgi:hypothetical protein
MNGESPLYEYRIKSYNRLALRVKGIYDHLRTGRAHSPIRARLNHLLPFLLVVLSAALAVLTQSGL